MKRNLVLIILLFIIMVPLKVNALNNYMTVTEVIDVKFNPEDQRLNYESLCSNSGIKQAVKIIGYVISVCKWVIPLIIIILGMIDFSKAVISNDEKALSVATTSLIKRFIVGVIVFLLPTIVMAILKGVKVTNGIESNEFGACTTCLFDPSNCGTGMGTGGGGTAGGESGRK